MDISFIYKNLGLDEDTLSAALKSYDGNKELFEKYKTSLLKGKSNILKKADAVTKLAAALYTLPAAYENYKRKGIPDDIFLDTFSDIKIWCDNAYEQYGVYGLVNIRWITKHLSMKIFRIGRLQYEFSRFAILPHAGIKSILKCPYRLGEKCIALHIPQGEKLDTGRCFDSLKSANAFFEKYYPDYKYRCYNVITWLLDPELEYVLGSDSNIVRFGKMFTLLGRVPDSDMNERRVFGYKKDRKNYRPDNALRVHVLDRIKKGKPLYSYNGFRPKNV